MELEGRLNELRAKGLGLAAISYDSPQILAAFSKQRGITFPLLSDAGSATIKRYGILNTLAAEAFGPNAKDPVIQADVRKYVAVIPPNTGMVGMAFPGTLILDRQGRVTSRFFEEFYVERNTISSLMLQLGGPAGARVEALQISGPHLDLTAYPSDAEISVGNRFSVALDLRPGPGIHLYAPGAKGYKAVVLTIDPQPFVRVLPPKYPASQIYDFKPLKERVPVYQKPFTLAQELVLEGSQQAQAALRGKDHVTITGSLAYQACDAKTCFNPDSLPLTWTVKLRPLVLERPKP